MPKAQELLYAVVGAGDFAVNKVKSVKIVADRKKGQKLYRDFVKRGRTLSTKVKNSTPGKQVRTQTESARKQVNETARNVQKTLGVNIQSWPKARKTGATKAAPKKTTAKAS